mgnify:CR=1 FL=1
MVWISPAQATRSGVTSSGQAPCSALVCSTKRGSSVRIPSTTSTRIASVEGLRNSVPTIVAPMAMPASVATVISKPITQWREFSGMVEAVHNAVSFGA